jgi:hypothetical protein
MVRKERTIARPQQFNIYFGHYKRQMHRQPDRYGCDFYLWQMAKVAGVEIRIPNVKRNNDAVWKEHQMQARDAIARTQMRYVQVLGWCALYRSKQENGRI